MEDEENLSKSSQKILKSQQEKGRRQKHDYENEELTFLVYHKEYEDFLNSLRELGVVHIVEKQQGAAENAELQG